MTARKRWRVTLLPHNTSHRYQSRVEAYHAVDNDIDAVIRSGGAR